MVVSPSRSKFLTVQDIDFYFLNHRPPQIVFSDRAHTHDNNWDVIKRAGEMAPGIQSVIWHTYIDCLLPWIHTY